MQNKLKGIAYVSVWVIIWGTLGSLIDFPLLQNEVYEASSIGQYITFSLTAIISIVISIILYPRIFKTDS